MKTVLKKCHTHMCATGCNKNITCFYSEIISTTTEQHTNKSISLLQRTSLYNKIKQHENSMIKNEKRVLFLKPNQEYITWTADFHKLTYKDIYDE